MAHRIRLRQPWTIHVPPPSAMSDDKPNVSYSRHVVLTRRFNRPTGLTDRDRVDLEINVEHGFVETVMLNDDVVYRSDDDSSEVPQNQLRLRMDASLNDHNRLHITLVSDSQSPRLGDVNLWITEEPDTSTPRGQADHDLETWTSDHDRWKDQG